jgi:hypothetical protein
MAEQITSGAFDPNSVRKFVSVQAPREVAWRVFTEQMGTWWPLATYKIGKVTLWMQSSNRAWVAVGMSAATMEVRATGAACSLGSRTRGSCSPGTSPPTGTMTKNAIASALRIRPTQIAFVPAAPPSGRAYFIAVFIAVSS